MVGDDDGPGAHGASDGGPEGAASRRDTAAVPREEGDRYRMLVETVGDPMYVLDEDGVVEMANAAMAEVLDRPLSELEGAHVSLFMPESDVARGTELLLELADDPDHRWASFEMDVVRPDGEQIHCEDRVAALTDDDGRLVGSVGVVRDITERVRERERLRDLTNRIERLHSVATELQTATDPDRVYDLAVDAGQEILGFDWCVVALAEDGWFELVAVSETAPVDVGVRHLRVDEGLAGEAYQRGESMLTGDAHADERSRPVHESFVASIVVPLGDIGVFQANADRKDQFDGRDVELAELLCAHVFEALRRIEHAAVLREHEQELARQNERLEQFASAISHDLRNPLNLADGHLDLARERVTDEGAANHLDEVSWAIDRIDRLIDEVLTLARQGQQPQDTTEVVLADVMADAWATAADDDATLSVAGSLGVVEADRDRLQRLLENLVRNAMEHAGLAPRLVVGPTETGFFVSDDGPGIPPEERERVFESGYSTTEDGTGFGLAIVRELAAAHGWSVAVAESEAGGARFEFSGVEFTD